MCSELHISITETQIICAAIIKLELRTLTVGNYKEIKEQTLSV